MERRWMNGQMGKWDRGQEGISVCSDMSDSGDERAGERDIGIQDLGKKGNVTVQRALADILRSRVGDFGGREASQRSSSTCSTESTISFTSSRVTPGMIRSASVKAR